MAKQTFKSTKVPGIRFNSRSKKYEPLATFFLGSFDSIAQATKVRESFIRKVDLIRKPKNGLSDRERKHDEQEAKKIVATHLKKSAASHSTAAN